MRGALTTMHNLVCCVNLYFYCKVLRYTTKIKFVYQINFENMLRTIMRAMLNLGD